MILAVELLDDTHPLYKTFIAWLNGKEPTKRQARKFLQENPQWNQSRSA